jgi:glutamyl-tRNA synthetase
MPKKTSEKTEKAGGKSGKWTDVIYAYGLKNAIEHDGKAVVGALIAGLFSKGLKKEEVKDVMPEVNKVLKEINSWNIEKQKQEFSKYEEIIGHRPEREGLPELENVSKTGVRMRFAPSSSASAFHIGHIMTGMPSSLYVKKYGGSFDLRIEDTNPEKTVKECYESFPKEADWIFGNVTKTYVQSDRMQMKKATCRERYVTAEKEA